MFDTFPDIMSVQDLMKALNIGRNKAYYLINNNQIRHIRMGKTIKIPKVCLIEYVYTVSANFNLSERS